MLRLGEVVRRSAAAALPLGIFAALGASPACTTDHDALARKPTAGSSGGGTGGGGGLGGFGNTGNNEPQGGRVNPDDEAKGDDVLTIVNGVVDAPSLRLCFARLSEDRQSSTLVGSPLPELAYAGATVVTKLEELSLADDAIQPWVIAGDLGKIAELDCAAAVELAQAEEAKVTPEPPPEGDGQGGEGGAGGAAPALEKPALRARALAALPAGTVAIGRSILLVLTGCIGGAAYHDGAETAVCGDDYTPEAPTLQPIVVKLSRELGFDKVGLQGLHASLAMGSADLRVGGDGGQVAIVFASSLTFGVIAPRPADTHYTAVDVGVGEPDYGLQAIGEQAEILHQESWADVLSASGLSELAAARTYTAVLLGPKPHLLSKGWWNPPAFALVDNDPTRK